MQTALKRSQNWSRLLPCGLILAFFSLTAFIQFNTDPVARLGALTGGNITAEDFKKHEGLNAVIDEKNQIRECKVTSFNLIRVAKKQDPVEVIHRSAKFNTKSKVLVEKATAGDVYYIDEVNARCPGDLENRKINSLVFKIK